MRKSRKVPGVLVLLLVAIASLVATSGPASAHNGTSKYGTLKVSDKTTTAKKCVTETVEFVPAATLVDWRLTVDVDNTTSALTFPSFTMDAAHLTHAIVLCPGKQPAGDYRLNGYLQGNESPTPPGSACCSVASGLDAYFTFRVLDRKPTALTVSVKRSRDANHCPLRKTQHCSSVNGKLVRAGKPMAGEYVQIQALKHGRWVRQAWGRTDGLGRVGWYVTISSKEKHLKLRLYYELHDYAKASASRTFTVLY